jgi:hypothetical protein
MRPSPIWKSEQSCHIRCDTLSAKQGFQREFTAPCTGRFVQPSDSPASRINSSHRVSLLNRQVTDQLSALGAVDSSGSSKFDDRAQANSLTALPVLVYCTALADLGAFSGCFLPSDMPLRKDSPTFCGSAGDFAVLGGASPGVYKSKPSEFSSISMSLFASLIAHA